MRIPDSLASLVDHGILDEVVRPLMSGKEAQVYLVLSGGQQRVAKVYKESQNRTFKNRAEYTEGRRVRSSRDQRAMDKRSRYGRAQDEAAWRSAEVDMIYRLAAAGVRVPKPYHFIDGVLIMELVSDEEGNPAPRLGDLVYTPEQATWVFERLISETARMLCAGVVHGDLSDFNVLMAADGPVIIDFPQAVNASGNQNARRILIRDVANLQRFLAKYVPPEQPVHYAEEMWALYERNALTPDTRLTGQYRPAQRTVKTEDVMSLVKDAEREERRRREGLKLAMRGLPRDTPQREERGNPRAGQGRAGQRPGQQDRAGQQQRTPMKLELPQRDQQRRDEPQTGRREHAQQRLPMKLELPQRNQRRDERQAGRRDHAQHRPPMKLELPQRDQRRDERQPPRNQAQRPPLKLELPARAEEHRADERPARDQSSTRGDVNSNRPRRDWKP